LGKPQGRAETRGAGADSTCGRVVAKRPAARGGWDSGGDNRHRPAGPASLPARPGAAPVAGSGGAGDGRRVVSVGRRPPATVRAASPTALPARPFDPSRWPAIPTAAPGRGRPIALAGRLGRHAGHGPALPRNTTGQSIVRCPARREITNAASGSGQRARRRRNTTEPPQARPARAMA
jgi:hypothetical protein